MTDYDIFRKRLKQAIEESSLNQAEVARRLSISSSTVSSYLSGKNDVTTEKIIEIGRVLNKSPQWFFGASDLDENEISNAVQISSEQTTNIPIYGVIFANNPQGATEDIQGDIAIPIEFEKTYGKRNLLALRIDGESMNKIAPNGSIAILAKTDDWKNGDIMGVLINGDSATIKHVYKYSDHMRFEPDSWDNSFEPFEYIAEQYDNDNPPIVTVGKLLQVINEI